MGVAFAERVGREVQDLIAAAIDLIAPIDNVGYDAVAPLIADYSSTYPENN